MAERFKAADCKSVEYSHRRFESCFLHLFEMFLVKVLQGGKKHNPKMLSKLKNQIQEIEYGLEHKVNKKTREVDISKFPDEFLVSESTDLPISYIISVKFSLTNSSITLSNAIGETKFFYSAGSAGFIGKQKKNKKRTFIPLLRHFLDNCFFVKNKPIALHLYNTSFHKKLVVKEISKYCLILFINSIDATPHNGCRPSKKRRKKYRTKKTK